MVIITTYDKQGKVCCVHHDYNNHGCDCHKDYNKVEVKKEIPIAVVNNDYKLNSFYPSFCEVCGGEAIIYSGLSKKYKTKSGRICHAGFCSKEHMEESINQKLLQVKL